MCFLSSCISFNRKYLKMMNLKKIFTLAKSVKMPMTHNFILNADFLLESLLDATKHRNGSQNVPIPIKIGQYKFLNDINENDINNAIRLYKSILNNEKILITGTSSGLGYQIAETLVKKYNIVGLSRSIGKAKNINKKKFKFINLDLSNFREFEKLNKIKHVDCLINNSAIFSLKNFESISEDEIIKTININMIGTILLTKKILENNKKIKKIINILSVSGLNGIKNQTIYSATKHGLKGFFDSLSQEKLIKYQFIIYFLVE